MRCCILAILGCAVLPAQDGKIVEQDLVSEQAGAEQAGAEQSAADQAGRDDTGPATTNDVYVPLTLWQNYVWSLDRIFAPGELFVVGARTAIDHSRSQPSSWGGGTGGYAKRVASRLGRIAVREDIAFAVRALDHEDPRYFHSPEAGGWKRARYAVGRTFVVRNDHGGNMPAYSLLLADFATPFITQMWRPEPVDAGRDLRAGAIGIGFAAAGNLSREFWPDIRKKLHR
jgi:hypothetical protein